MTYTYFKIDDQKARHIREELKNIQDTLAQNALRYIEQLEDKIEKLEKSISYNEKIMFGEVELWENPPLLKKVPKKLTRKQIKLKKFKGNINKYL